VSERLYRGVNAAMHKQNGGRILPRRYGMAFAHEFTCDDMTITCDNTTVTIRPSAQNAVMYHQLGTPDTSGISTTPHLDRARHYATRGGTVPGVIYVIDRTKLPALGVCEHVVKDIVFGFSVTVPEDDEVILVAADTGELSPDVIVDRIDVSV